MRCRPLLRTGGLRQRLHVIAKRRYIMEVKHGCVNAVGIPFSQEGAELLNIDIGDRDADITTGID